ncbi:MAG: hypothetical protein H0V80_12490 [Acidobacteria bacterium]|nr:hypothetical protein [Acidobacteriota bacterium]
MSDLRALLQSADLPDDVRASLQALIPEPLPSLDAVLGRLSLSRTFTPGVYEWAVDGLDPAPTLEQLVASGEVTRLNGYTDRYTVAAATRVQRLTHWASDRDGCAARARALLPLLDPNDPVERLDRLQLAFLDDQSRARAALREAFQAADDAHQIPECSALVQLVAPVIRLFGDTESTALLNELRSRSQSRNLYLAEFYQTTEYYPRPIEDDLRRFVNGPNEERWIFHLHATGGMGKTTLLRRLISHEWTIGHQHRPCAWVDFDYLDVATVLQHPALLGLAMAAQWNEQLEQPVFGAFLTTSFQPLGSLLFRTRSDASARGLSSPSVEVGARAHYRAGLSNPMRCGFLAGAVPPRTLEERTLRLSQTPVLLSYWTDRLPDCIASMPTDRPVVLVLDTLEDASLHHGQQLLETLRLLATLRRQAHKVAHDRGQPLVQFRLVISGRHALGEDHVPEFAREFAGQYESHALQGLGDTEARAFLAHLVDRKDAEHEALLDAIVVKSEGIPFNLSLFAEWANAAQSLDAETVLASEDVSTAMLIERVVRRIPYEPLRWIVRYGVVPRTLTSHYLRDVMREPLVDALCGRAATEGRDQPRSAIEQDVWKPQPGFVFDAQALWKDHVLPYSAERSWMSPGENPDEVVFRSDIRQPMRRLLRSQRVFAQLHERSRDWFRARAAQPGASTTASVEWLYHELQLRSIPGRAPVHLMPYLAALLDGPLLRHAHDLRAVVCQALRGSDFDGFTPREQAYVRYRLAEALGAQHDYSYAHPEAVRALQFAFEDQEAASELPGFALEWRRLAGGTNLSLLLRAVLTLEDPDDRLRLAVLIADVADRGSALVADVLGRALELALQQGDPVVPPAVVRQRLARSLETSDPDASIAHLIAAADDWAQRGDRATATEQVCRASALHLSLGRLRRAEQVLERDGLIRSPELRLHLARIELAKGNPGEAIALLAVDDQLAGPRLAELWCLRAEALSQRMRVREATDAWEQAERAARQHGDSRHLADVAVGQASFYHWRLRTTRTSTPGGVQSLLQRLSHVEGAVQSSGRYSAKQSPRPKWTSGRSRSARLPRNAGSCARSGRWRANRPRPGYG